MERLREKDQTTWLQLYFAAVAIATLLTRFFCYLMVTVYVLYLNFSSDGMRCFHHLCWLKKKNRGGAMVLN